MPVYKDADEWDAGALPDEAAETVFRFFRSAEDWLVYFSRVVFSFILKRER